VVAGPGPPPPPPPIPRLLPRPSTHPTPLPHHHHHHLLQVTIASPDKDFLQLLRPQVRLLRKYEPAPQSVAAPSAGAAAAASPGGGGGGAPAAYARQQPVFYTLQDFERDYGLQPCQWPDVLALWGDASDNIRGVEGLGEKGALELVGAHGGVEAAIAAASALQQGQQQGQQHEGLRAGPAAGGPAAAGQAGGGRAGGKLRLLASPGAQLAARLSRELVRVRSDLRLPGLEQLDLARRTRLAVPADGGVAAVHHVGGQLGLDREALSLARLYERLAARAAGGAAGGAGE
jgi:5'-3' exonuclease